jgi:hypothetical protein
MTSKAVNKFRIFCSTEAAYVYTWDDSVPTTCPHNNTHTIDADTIAIIDSVHSNAISVVQETGVTGGNYCCKSGALQVGTLSQASQDISWPFPISVACVGFTAGAQNVGDAVLSEVAPDTAIGVLTADAAPGGTVLSVSSTAVQYGVVGTWVAITDGATTQALGRILALDPVAGAMTVEAAPTAAMSAASPTYVQMTYRNIDVHIPAPGSYVFGARSLRASYIPANTTIRISYTNNHDPADSVGLSFTWQLEFYY